MDKKIVVCSCTEFGYEIVDFLLANGISISYLVSLSPEQAIQYKVSGYKSFEPLSKKYNISIYYAGAVGYLADKICRRTPAES